jgi:ubiquinone/menaquinone biosynthesis C-methylase UbiE
MEYDFDAPAAHVGAWREFDPDNPDPGYLQFDWISARHPDLYHQFALSTEGLMRELPKVVDLTDMTVVDVGAGTGRATQAAANVAEKIYAVDAYQSVIDYGARLVREAGLPNVEYRRGDRSALPFDDDSIDAVICAWAVLDPVEAARVLKPGGVLVQMASSPDWIAGELTPVLFAYVAENESPELAEAIFGMDPSSATIDLTAAPRDTTRPEPDWDGVPTLDGVHDHDFTYLAEYASPELAEAILGRIYGPAVGAYIRDRQQRTIAWSLRITSTRVAK